MRVPAHIRFTLAELSAYGLQSAQILAKADSAIHLVLTERQRPLPNAAIEAACAIISVEDADGITLAVLKHPEGKAWDRRPLSADVATPGGIEIRDLRSGADASQIVRLDVLGRDPNYVAKGVRSEPEPVVPRREPPHAAPAGEGRFNLGVKAMKESLHRQFKDGGMERITWGERGPGGDDPKNWPDIIGVEGDIDMEALGRAFWSAMKGEG